jgi:hypothetical protein
LVGLLQEQTSVTYRFVAGQDDVTKDVSHLTFEEVEEELALQPGLPDHACKVRETRVFLAEAFFAS